MRRRGDCIQRVLQLHLQVVVGKQKMRQKNSICERLGGQERDPDRYRRQIRLKKGFWTVACHQKKQRKNGRRH